MGKPALDPPAIPQQEGDLFYFFFYATAQVLPFIASSQRHQRKTFPSRWRVDKRLLQALHKPDHSAGDELGAGPRLRGLIAALPGRPLAATTLTVTTSTAVVAREEAESGSYWQ